MISVDSTYNNFYTIISVVKSKGGVVKPLDVCPSTYPYIHRSSLGLK